MEAMVASRKTQPPEIKVVGYEKQNEETLRLIDDFNVIIRDNSGVDDLVDGEILTIKIGTLMKENPSEEETAVSASLLESLKTALFHYLATDSLIVQNIESNRGPRVLWETMRGKSTDLKNYLRSIYPLTKLTEHLFKALPPDFFEKVHNSLPITYLTQEEKDWFGIQTSRGTVLSTFTNAHVDINDIPLGFCAITLLGEFTDGHLCLPSLGVKLTLQPGCILFLRSYLLPHYVGKWTGNRFSIVQYTHQSIFDYFTEQTGEAVFPMADMPPWYQERYNN
ncbi:hypothetical protein L873DRAFT_1785133 [Choiromyces venosus 120613-1]|uniref:Prolyl 4-hydroxylase alpha subunit Fe(2+) 2OG dioxygenase domain-containing protein n=1 Tax=Choiromyces venosus 120613-1 TaxID=1336337 RepID=A0A3N4K9G4_9PEZI|nr:hypothetical protein L873DRAFT_1785133 [Choiromyces venosus 120613-1]